MSKKIRNNKSNKKIEGKINQNVSDLKSPSHDESKGKISFLKVCSTRYRLSAWQEEELTDLVNCFQKIENSTWKEIKRDGGLNYKPVKHIAVPPPSNAPPDAQLMSLKVCEKKRLYGYRIFDYFYIVWFDRNHEVCAMSKQKYSV